MDNIYKNPIWKFTVFKQETSCSLFSPSSDIAYDLLTETLKKALDWIYQNDIDKFEISHNVNVFQGNFGSTTLVTVAVMYQK